MSELQSIARRCLLVVLAVGVLAGCIPGEDDDGPTQTPVVIVITSTPTATPESTPTAEPTATLPATSTPTPEPSPTPESTPTPMPTLVPRPTRGPIVINTPTPQPGGTSTESGNAPALGEVLLQTDFSNWPNQEFEFGSLVYGDDGLYHVVVTEGGGTYVSAYSIDHEPFTDVAISVDVRMVAGDPSTTGCVLTRVDQIDQLYDYALCVDGNGNIEALYEQFDAEGAYSSEVLLPAGQVAVAPPVEWLTLTIISRGEEFWFLANGELVGTAVHSGPTGGSAGVIVNHFIDPPQTPAEFTFTNLVVQALQ